METFELLKHLRDEVASFRKELEAVKVKLDSSLASQSEISEILSSKELANEQAIMSLSEIVQGMSSVLSSADEQFGSKVMAYVGNLHDDRDRDRILGMLKRGSLKVAECPIKPEHLIVGTDAIGEKMISYHVSLMAKTLPEDMLGKIIGKNVGEQFNFVDASGAEHLFTITNVYEIQNINVPGEANA